MEVFLKTSFRLIHSIFTLYSYAFHYGRPNVYSFWNTQQISDSLKEHEYWSQAKFELICCLEAEFSYVNETEAKP